MRTKIASGPAVVPVAPVVTGRRKIASGPAVEPAVVSAGALVNAFWAGDRVVGVTAEGKLKHQAAKHTFYVRHAALDLDDCRKLREKRAVAGMQREGDWWRIDCRDYEGRQSLIRLLHMGKPGGRTYKEPPFIPTYEGDLSPVRRYMLDQEPAIAAPRACYLDLETDSRVPFSQAEARARILCFAIVRPDLTLVASHVLAADTDDAERNLLIAMWTALAEFDQVNAWNGDRFDFPIIKQRTKDRGLRVPLKRWLFLDHMELFRRMNTMAAESGEEKASFSLDAICKAVLGPDAGKLDFDASQTYEEWAAEGARRQAMHDYCVHDTTLMPMLEKETGYIALLNTLCEVTGTFPDSRGINPQQQVESFLLRLAKKRGIKPATRVQSYEERERVPANEYAIAKATENAQFRGAFVMQPKVKGFARGVHVCDFASLYPSIILSWNMSPETVVAPPPNPNDSRPNYLPRVEWKLDDHIPPGSALAPITGVLFDQTKPGMLPDALEEMMKLRKFWNDKKAAAVPGTAEAKDAERRSTAYKIAANSFYGVAGAQTSRFYLRECAESVAQAGVWLIKQTIEQAEEQGMKAIYGDTDSAFVQGTTEQGFGAFVDWCNKSFYPDLLKAQGCARNTIKLAYEKEFAWVVFVSAKRYVGKYAHYKGTRSTEDSKPEVRGLEYKRGDTMRLARNFQKQVIDLMMLHEDHDLQPYVEAVLAQREFILSGELPFADFVIAKRLSQSLKSYKVRVKKDGTSAAGQPHVAIGHILKARGRDMGEGAKVEYVCVDGSTSPKSYVPAEDYGREIDGKPARYVDRHELWGSLVWPPTQRLLEAAFPAEDWDQYSKTRPAKARARKAKEPHSMHLPGFGPVEK